MPVHEQIVELLRMPEAGAGAPSLARVEDTLTEGYARALALEAERLRIERRLGEVARDADRGDPTDVVESLAALSERLTIADSELVRLRSLLASLRDRAIALRRA